MRILIVEDDQRLARQLKKGLDENGHAVSLAFDGLEGLEAARQGHFDVLVLDVMLPWLDGFGVVKQLRSLGSKSPILMLTARDSAEDIVTGTGRRGGRLPDKTLRPQGASRKTSSARTTQGSRTANSAPD